jgi:hypothetical protein
MAEKKEVVVVETKELDTKLSGMMTMVQETKVTNETELNEVSDKIKGIKNFAKYVEQQKDKLVAPAKAIIAEAKAKYDPYIDKCEEAESQLKGKAKVYMMKVQAEKDKKEAEIAKKVEEGKMTETKAVEKLEKIDEKKSSASTGQSSLGLRKVPVCKIVDESKIPDEYWIIDEVKLSKVVKAGVEVPGAKLEYDYTTNSR